MAVSVGTIGVNPNGSGEPQTGWTQAHVMDALEKVFYEMGWNSGTQKDGVPIAVLYPGFDITSATAFDSCIRYHYDTVPQVNGSNLFSKAGGSTGIGWKSEAIRHFYVTNNGTSTYEIAEELVPVSWNLNNNQITVNSYDPTQLPNGTKLTYNGQGTDVITGLSSGQVYYMRSVSSNQITLHDTASNAQDPSGTAGIQSCTAGSLPDPLRFRTDASSNVTITAIVGDELKFYDHATTAGGNFRICDFVAGSVYNSDRDLHLPVNVIDSAVSGNGTYASPYLWDTRSYYQTENEVQDPTQITGVGYQGLAAYGYTNTNNASLKGSIILNPGTSNNNSQTPYWKYTVPASGNRSELKLRIYRDPYTTDIGKVNGILICNEATGWTDNEQFTIPGTAVGGTTPAHDIEFGPNTNETSSGAGDGKCSILTTSLGSGANMFQKHPDGYFGVLRLENDANKKFGHTYWGFSLIDDYQITLSSGSGWSYLNRLGKHWVDDYNYEGFFGRFNGSIGLDCQYNGHLHRHTTDRQDIFNYALNAGPTNYPLKIRYYKAQAPQDTNFAVIQFIHVINSIEKPYFTFSLNKGPNFGSGIWDLDELWNGSYTLFDWASRNGGTPNSYVDTQYRTPGYAYSNSGVHDEPLGSYSLAREASFGYLRDTGSSSETTPITRYRSNIKQPNEDYSYNEIRMYYRNSTYDKLNYTYNNSVKVTVNGIDSVGVSYYKPIKGLPISNALAPCPYYMPDDFVMIQVEVTPGATQFLPGDTVTISGSEAYTIIVADNLTNTTGQDGVTGGTANGMIFAARHVG